MERKRLNKGIYGLLFSFMLALTITAGNAQAGSLEPSGPPGPTTQIPPAWSQIIPGADRFELVLGNAAVLDKETGLVWEKTPDATTRIWTTAINHCFYVEVGGRKGWRLPTIEELASLVDSSVASGLRLPGGHPFSNVQSLFYWSSTTHAGNTTVAWSVHFNSGGVNTNDKANGNFVWCVRGGQGVYPLPVQFF